MQIFLKWLLLLFTCLQGVPAINFADTVMLPASYPYASTQSNYQQGYREEDRFENGSKDEVNDLMMSRTLLSLFVIIAIVIVDGMTIFSQ